MISAVEKPEGPPAIKAQAFRRQVFDLLWEQTEGHHRGTAE